MKTSVHVRSLPQVVGDPTLDTSTYEKKFIPFWQMRGQKYNPPDRTNHQRDQYKELRESIQTNGIVTPIVLTSDLEKIDGHVRSEIGTELGMEGTICLIAPFDSEDPRADQLYFLINQRVPMTPSQKIQVVAGGGLGNATITRIYREGVKSLGAEGYYYNLWKEHRFVPQMWNNCKKTADLVFNNGLVRDRPAREALVHRAVMKWQCTGEKRQQSLKDYHTSISKGKSGATVKKLWNAIEKGEDLQLS